jgi:chemotaxis protein methyltransferase CheR
MPSAAAAEAADPAPAVPVEPVRPVTPIAPAPAPAPIVAAPLDPLAQARKCADQGRLDEALGACRDAIARERTCLAAHWLYATICDELGRLDEAIAAFGKVLYLDQDFILAHHALGGLYRRLGKQEQSGRHLAIALELLSKRSRDEIVPESDTITCGRLAESVRTMTGA